ncbi:class I SAM-dependent methyltransferase [Nocardioides dilutus]
MLDAGAGNARYRDHFAHAKYETSDLVVIDRGDAPPDYVCSVDDMPMADDTYDLVFCSQVLEHVTDPRAALAEIHRVLKPTGQVWISAPLFYEEHEQPFDFRRYTQFEWRRLAGEAGFDIVSIDWLEGYYGTVSYQLQMFARCMSRPWLPVRAVALLAAYFFAKLDVRRKVTDRGMPKNYCVVMRPA